MSKQEQYHWKEAMKHIEQAEYHKRIASILLDGIIAKYYSERQYEQESLHNLAQALN